MNNDNADYEPKAETYLPELKPRWNKSEVDDFVRSSEIIARERGYHVGLTGSFLYGAAHRGVGITGKDVDLILYPIRNRLAVSVAHTSIVSMLGLTVDVTYVNAYAPDPMEVWITRDAQGRRVDVFFLK